MSADHSKLNVRPGEMANVGFARTAMYTRTLPSFAGVALADILANGVTIVIIMIVITLMARHQEEEEKLEQAQEVSVLLSRELASSLVMNALPTSPPAQLHNYKTSPMDRNPQHSKMPIIELHDEFIRDYYTGRRYSRDELLLQDNAFDAYISSLTPVQLLALRVDIYSIRQFYIAMSILKAHRHSPRHWHFLGETAAVGEGQFDGGILEAFKGEREWREDSAPGEGGALTSAAGSLGGSPLTAPSDVVPGEVPGGTRNYPLSGRFAGGGGLTYGAGNNWAVPQEYFDLPNTNADDAGTGGEGDGTQPFSGGGQRSNQQHFRVAAPEAANPDDGTGEVIDVGDADVLRGLFAFMLSVQKDTDQELPSRLAHYHFERDILSAPLPPVLATPPYASLFEYLAHLFSRSGLPISEVVGLPLVLVPSSLRGQVLAVPMNAPIRRAEWRQNADQTPPEDLASATEVTIRLSLHAEVYQGLRAPLELGSIVLMPLPERVPDPVPRWRVVTLVSPALDDFITGFIHAGVDDDGKLLISMDENAVEVDGLRVESYFPPLPWRHQFWRLVFYSVIAVLAVVLIFNWYRRRA